MTAESARFGCIAIVPAGGSGARFGASVPKQYIEIAGATVLEHSLSAVCAAEGVEHVFLVVQSEDVRADAILAGMPLSDRVTILKCAGETRAQTVLNAMHAVRKKLNRDAWIVVHDAARPCITSTTIETLLHVAGGDDSVGGLLALPVTDSLKRASASGDHVETVPREGMWRAQTPQMFRYETLVHALTSSPDVTDESQAIEALGLNPVLVHGDPRNIKITIAEDAEMAELFLKEAQSKTANRELRANSESEIWRNGPLP